MEESGTRHQLGTAVSREEKKFACTHAGCSKRFTRSEHLQRHALNHTAGSSTCLRCSAHFKRPDLLERHMDRHRQKDIEAGGEGCGVLDTRKRAWKAADGTVVERRPHPAGRARTSGITANYTTIPPRVAGVNQPLEFPTSPVSEEGSHEALVLPEQYDSCLTVPLEEGSRANIQHVPQSFPSALPHSSAALDQPGDNSLLTSVLPVCQSDPWKLWQEQPFQPDTASSFNMPYTTALDYNWLFNLAAVTPETRPGIPDQGLVIQGLDQVHSGAIIEVPQTPTTFPAGPDSYGASDKWPESIETTSPPTMDESLRQDARLLPTSDPHMRHQSHILEGSVSPGQQTELMNMAAMAITPDQSSTVSARFGNDYGLLEVERPLSILVRPISLPQIDDITHESLQHTVEGAKPLLPDQHDSLRDHPFMSKTSLQSYLDLFFTRFNAAYPIIHMATFEPSSAEPLLLLSIILLGATYANKDAHKVAVCIHDVIRPSIFAHAGFSARPPLWALQTILLVECFGKSRAGQKQHDMSHLFHGLLINLIRRSDCQSVRPVPPPEPVEGISSGSLDVAWRKWAEAEQKKRLALNCFMWDTQHAVLFCQSLCMSAFELRLHFPCSQSVWEAEDATSWATAWQKTYSTHNSQTQPFYLPTLKSYLSSRGPPLPPGLGAHSRVLVLHGLMSIFWDMQRRDQTALGAVSDTSGTNWRDIITVAYDRWKADFDEYAAAIMQQPWLDQLDNDPTEDLGEVESARSEFKTYVAAAKAVYYSAQCLLRMDFLDIQIYAGARHILGRPVQQGDYLHSAQVVRRWAASTGSEITGDVMRNVDSARLNDAVGAAWHAARMLRDVLPEADSEAMASLSHVPWCLYLATLTCWAFVHAHPNRTRAALQGADSGVGRYDMEIDEMVWDSKGEMQALVAAMAEGPSAPLRVLQTQSRRRVIGLVWVMADILTKVRWGIVHSGVLVLRGLVPARLVNQYEVEE